MSEGTTTAAAELPAAALRDPGRQGGKRRFRRKRIRALLWVEYALLRIVLAALGLLPLGAAYRLAELVVHGFLFVVPKYRRRILAHLDIAFGDEQTPEWKHRVRSESVRYLAWYFVDVLFVSRLLRQERYRQRVDVSALDEAFRRDGVLEKQGALVVASHQGSPDVGAHATALAGWPNSVVVRKLDNPFLWDYTQRERAWIPCEPITKDGALRAAHRILREHGIVGIQIDQDPRKGGVFVPYFGVPARTSEGAAALALISGAPVYMMTCIRTRPRAFEHRILLDGPLELERSGDHDRDVLELTARMTAEVERMVRRFPEQVMWAHRRWKTRPPEEAERTGGTS